MFSEKGALSFKFSEEGVLSVMSLEEGTRSLKLSERATSCSQPTGLACWSLSAGHFKSNSGNSIGAGSAGSSIENSSLELELSGYEDSSYAEES